MFRVSPSPLDPEALRRELLDDRAGGFVSFEGRVRSQNDNRSVGALEYEAFVELAEKEGEKILAEARARYAIFAAACVHRVGRLAVGELAVWVGVAAEHRGDAFEACRYIIDAAKARVPIWKREHYRSGDSAWINAGAADPRVDPQRKV